MKFDLPPPPPPPADAVSLVSSGGESSVAAFSMEPTGPQKITWKKVGELVQFELPCLGTGWVGE